MVKKLSPMNLPDKMVLISLTTTRAHVMRPADMSEISTGCKKDWLKAMKRILVSKEITALDRWLDDAVDYVRRRSFEWVLRRGIYALSYDALDEVDEHLIYRLQGLPALLDKLELAMPDQILEAKIELGPQFNDRDYPSFSWWASKYTINWEFMSMDLPGQLQRIKKDIYERERAEQSRKFTERMDAFHAELYQKADDVVSYLGNILTETEDGKRRKIFETTATAALEFFDYYKKLNVMDDYKFEQILERGKQLVNGKGVNDLKYNEEFRANLKAEMDKVKQSLSAAVAVHSRKVKHYDMPGEEAAAG